MAGRGEDGRVFDGGGGPNRFLGEAGRVIALVAAANHFLGEPGRVKPLLGSGEAGRSILCVQCGGAVDVAGGAGLGPPMPVLDP